MPESDFLVLRASLQDGGVSPAYIGRLMTELEDHYADLEREELAFGDDPVSAAVRARRRLGEHDAIAAAVLIRPELRSWKYRWPWVAAFLQPLMLILLLPSVPMFVCADRGPAIARWSVSISLAAVLTVGLLFGMAQSIFSAI
jgi:hypothetical protein